MDTGEDKVLCNDCGETLTTFLREIAEHNAEIVCPHCGKTYTRAEAEALAKSAEKGSEG